MTVTKQSVSVAIIHRNMGHSLKQAVKSAMTQTTRAALEVLVLDDASDDAASSLVLDDLAAEYADNSHVRFHRGQSVVGIACMRNIAALSAHGDILMFVDADDWIGPEYVERMRAGLDKAGADWVTGSCYVAVYPDGKKVTIPMTRVAALTYGSMSAYRTRMVRAMGGWTAGFDLFGGDEGFEFAVRAGAESCSWAEVVLQADGCYHYFQRHAAGSPVRKERALSLGWACQRFALGASPFDGTRHPELVVTPPSAPVLFPDFRELARERWHESA